MFVSMMMFVSPCFTGWFLALFQLIWTSSHLIQTAVKPIPFWAKALSYQKLCLKGGLSHWEISCIVCFGRLKKGTEPADKFGAIQYSALKPTEILTIHGFWWIPSLLSKFHRGSVFPGGKLTSGLALWVKSNCTALAATWWSVRSLGNPLDPMETYTPWKLRWDDNGKSNHEWVVVSPIKNWWFPIVILVFRDGPNKNHLQDL